jgi:hypothetical protein
MGRKRYILFRIIFLLAILVNSGVTVSSDGVLNTKSIELTPNENAVEPGLWSDNTIVFDEQREQFYNFRLADIHESYHGVPDDFSILHNFCISVWHPPEIS